eukprot:7799720-Prorocentrum_lima.AAC.1
MGRASRARQALLRFRRGPSTTTSQISILNRCCQVPILDASISTSQPSVAHRVPTLALALALPKSCATGRN